MVRGNFPWVGVVCIQGFARTRTQIHICEWRGYGADRAVLFGSLEFDVAMVATEQIKLALTCLWVGNLGPHQKI